MKSGIKLSRGGRVLNIDLNALRAAVKAGTLTPQERQLYKRVFGEYPEAVHPEWGPRKGAQPS